MQPDHFDNAIPTLGYFSNRSNSEKWSIEPAEIDFIDLTYIVKGQATYTIDGNKHIVKAGDLLCVPKGTMRSAITNVPTTLECFAANFHIHEFTTGIELSVPLPLISSVGIYPEIVSLYKRLNEVWLSRPPGYVMCARSYLMLILQRFLGILVYDTNTHQYDPRVKKAIRFITDNYADAITISTVADVVELNSVYFGALFKKETNVTFRDYLTIVRLNQAEDMLRTGKWNVTEVARNCGFTDVFYFSRLFKKHRGVPPSTYSAGVPYS